MLILPKYQMKGLFILRLITILASSPKDIIQLILSVHFWCVLWMTLQCALVFIIWKWLQWYISFWLINSLVKVILVGVNKPQNRFNGCIVTKWLWCLRQVVRSGQIYAKTQRRKTDFMLTLKLRLCWFGSFSCSTGLFWPILQSDLHNLHAITLCCWCTCLHFAQVILY